MLRPGIRLSTSILLALCCWTSGSALTWSPASHSYLLAQTPDEAILRTLVEQFFAAYAREDLASYVLFWSEKAPELASIKKSTPDLFKSVDQIEIKSLNVSRVTLEGDRAKVRVLVEISAVDAKTGEASKRFGKLNRSLQLVREQDGWKVWQNVSAEVELAARLVELKTDDERAALLAAEKELVTMELRRALISIGERQMTQGNIEQARTLFLYISELAAKIGDRAGVAVSLNGIGVTHRLRSEYPQALEYFHKALAINKEIDAKEGVGASLQLIGIVQEQLGNYSSSLDYLKQSLTIREAMANKARIPDVLNSMGIVHSRQGDHDLALESFQRALKLYEEEGIKAGVANQMNSIGNVHFDRGNYALALEMRQKGLALATELGHKHFIATALNNIGNIYSRQGSSNLALEYYQKSLALREELGDKTHIADSYGHIGAIYRAEGQYEKAEEYLQKALKMNEAVENKDGVIQMLNYLGNLSSARTQHERALDYYQKGLKIAEELGDKSMVAKFFANMAEEYRITGKYDEALSYSVRSAQLAREIKEPDTLLQPLVTGGKAARALNRLQQAQQYFEEAIATTESLRSQVAGTELEQQRFLEDKLSPYQALADLLVANNRPADALTYAERAKGRTLLTVLQNGKIDVTKAMTAGEREQERKLRGELVSLNTQISSESLKQKPDRARLSALGAQLDKARLNFETFQVNLYAAHPELRAQRGGSQLITLEQAKELLSDTHTAMLEYMVLDKKIILFVLTRNERRAEAELTVHTIDINQQDLERRAENYRKLLAQRNPDFSASARGLYDLLVAPARKQLAGKTRLLIVPDGPFWNLPFQALQSSDTRYLIDDYAIAYAPSLTVLREMSRLRGTRRDNPGAAKPLTLLAFGNPAISKGVVERVKFATRSERLDPLPEAEQEVKNIELLYRAAQSKVYIGADAQEGRAKSEAGKYRIIHLATHGVLNDVSPMYSYLVLSQVEGNSAEDGLLEAWEIMNVNLSADLVVLSACDTARGRIGAGEGVIGLSWAFFVAGAPTTLVSQWKVESSSTAQLMLEFHRDFLTKLKSPQQKPSEAEALRQAVIKLRQDERYRHPFYWAGFVVVGDGL